MCDCVLPPGDKPIAVNKYNNNNYNNNKPAVLITAGASSGFGWK
jgi:hypothetical protein